MQHLLNQIKKSPSRIFRSRNDIASRLNIDYDQVDEVMDYILRLGSEPTEITKQSEPYISERRYTNTGQHISITSDRPLSVDELTELTGADGFRAAIKKWWSKSKRGGTVWDYSIELYHLLPNFPDDGAIQSKIADLMPQYTPVKLPVFRDQTKDQRMAVYISDLHAGATNEGALYATPYKTGTLKKRLLMLVDKIAEIREPISSLDIAILGDQLDGFNGKTTRSNRKGGGHNLKSLPNADQFDIYLDAMYAFYEGIFNLGLTDKICIINVENSNHSGDAISYAANRTVREWLLRVAPEVEFISNLSAITHRIYGKHAFIYCHGYDEGDDKAPMPTVVTPAVEKRVQSYIRKHKLYEYFCHFNKGDSHQFAVTRGLGFRYHNCPSIVGGNNYSDANYAISQPGATINLYKPDSPEVATWEVYLQD